MWIKFVKSGNLHTMLRQTQLDLLSQQTAELASLRQQVEEMATQQPSLRESSSPGKKRTNKQRPASSKGKSRTDALKSPSACFLDGFPGSPTPAPGTASRPLIFEDYLTDAHTQSVARMAAYWSSDLFGETLSAGAGLSPSTSARAHRERLASR